MGRIYDFYERRVFPHVLELAMRQLGKLRAPTLAAAHGEVVDPREHAAVPGPEVEVAHGGHFRRIAPRIDVIGVDEEHEVAIHRHEFRVLRMHDEKAHHAHRHLHHLVGVRVVHEGARLLHLELVDEGLAHGDLRLREAADPVHAVGQQNSVPVDRRVLG